MPGKVYIVGAGPGDPDLITVKGLKLIEAADVILYDRLIPRELLSYAGSCTEFIYVGKERGRHSLTQDEINRLMVELASRHDIIVRLKGGDPYIYGRGEEECMYLIRSGVECEVVPGVSSIYAVPAYSGIPLTNRWLSSSFAVVTGEEASGKRHPRIDLGRIAGSVDTLVIVMGAGRFSGIISKLLSVLSGDTPIAVIMDGTTGRHRTIISRLGEAEKYSSNVRPPAIIILGEVVRLRDSLWRID